MKKINIGLLVLIFSTLFSSCNDKASMLTVLNKDGSMHRKISFISDSAAMQGNPQESCLFAEVIKDKAWKKDWKMEKTDSANQNLSLICHASRDFSTIKEAEEDYPIRINGKPVIKRCSLEKHFKWFYTDYEFKETFVDFSHLFKIPISKYLDKEAAEYWFTGNPDLVEGLSGLEAQDIINNISEKAGQWFSANMMNNYIDLFIESYEELEKVPISKAEMERQRDSLIEYAVKQGKKEEPISIDPGVIASNYFKNEYFANIENGDNPFAEKLNEQYENIFYPFIQQDIDYRVAMNGAKIIDKGNGVIKDKTIVFRLTPTRLLSQDYTIKAVFRATNYSAYILTILVILCVILCWKKRTNLRGFFTTSH